MKITICCSLTFNKEVNEIRDKLENMGHAVLMPETILECSGKNVDDVKTWIIDKKGEEYNNYEKDRMFLHFSKIKDSEAVLVCNFDKNNVKNYIGPNSFLEMAIGMHENKKIFLLNPIPEMNIKEEIEAIQPTILNGKLELIK